MKSGFHSVMADRMSWPPEKLILVVTLGRGEEGGRGESGGRRGTYVQLPTRLSQPVIHEAMGAHSRVASMADQ